MYVKLLRFTNYMIRYPLYHNVVLETLCILDSTLLLAIIPAAKTANGGHTGAICASFSCENHIRHLFSPDHTVNLNPKSLIPCVMISMHKKLDRRHV